jgi:hypothetical protein
MKLALVVLLLLSPLAAAEPPPSSDHLIAKKPFVVTSHYQSRQIEGWLVRINTDLLTTHKEIGDKILELLALKLREIRNCVPPNALAALLTVPIWLGVDDYAVPNAVYHGNDEWLRSHGWNPDKARSIEIGNAAIFVKWSKIQPMLLLHEFAHAYHDQVLTFQCHEVLVAYQHAVRSRLYESVEYIDGSKQRAYALNNEREYFAEATEAYFGRNDFAPFTRSELEQFDPEIFAILRRVWNR